MIKVIQMGSFKIRKFYEASLACVILGAAIVVLRIVLTQAQVFVIALDVLTVFVFFVAILFSFAAGHGRPTSVIETNQEHLVLSKIRRMEKKSDPPVYQMFFYLRNERTGDIIAFKQNHSEPYIEEEDKIRMAEDGTITVKAC